MGNGGWEWQADRERWVAHAPVEQGALVFWFVAVASQVLFTLTAPHDAPVRDHPWIVLPWLVIVVPWSVNLVWRARRQVVTYDGELVDVVAGLVHVRFRPEDISAVRPGPLVNRALLRVRVRPLERTIGGVAIPTRPRGTFVPTDVPSWWWHQVVAIPPERVTPWASQRMWARLRRRPRLAG